MSKKIYVVFGSTGEYSDRSEWAVTAYTTEADAKKHVEKATEYAQAWQAFTESDAYHELGYLEQDKRRNAANPMDPQFSCGYTGTSYWFAEIELRESFTAPEVIQ